MKKVISESALQARIIQLANNINQLEKHNETPVVFVGILYGAFLFFSDFQITTLLASKPFVRALNKYSGVNTK